MLYLLLFRSPTTERVWKSTGSLTSRLRIDTRAGEIHTNDTRREGILRLSCERVNFPSSFFNTSIPEWVQSPARVLSVLSALCPRVMNQSPRGSMVFHCWMLWWLQRDWIWSLALHWMAWSCSLMAQPRYANKGKIDGWSLTVRRTTGQHPCLAHCAKKKGKCKFSSRPRLYSFALSRFERGLLLILFVNVTSFTIMNFADTRDAIFRCCLGEVQKNPSAAN